MGSEGQITITISKQLYFLCWDNLSYLKAWFPYFRFYESYSFTLKDL